MYTAKRLQVTALARGRAHPGPGASRRVASASAAVLVRNGTTIRPAPC